VTSACVLTELIVIEGPPAGNCRGASSVRVLDRVDALDCSDTDCHAEIHRRQADRAPWAPGALIVGS
jgi:hypothetical protein